MTLTLGNHVLEFVAALIEFRDCHSTDLFSKKNNKTVHQTLLHRKYVHLTPRVIQAYPGLLERNLDDFLLQLKRNNNCLYRIHRTGTTLKFSNVNVGQPKMPEGAGGRV